MAEQTEQAEPVDQAWIDNPRLPKYLDYKTELTYRNVNFYNNDRQQVVPELGLIFSIINSTNDKYRVYVITELGPLNELGFPKWIYGERVEVIEHIAHPCNKSIHLAFQKRKFKDLYYHVDRQTKFIWGVYENNHYI